MTSQPYFVTDQGRKLDKDTYWRYTEGSLRSKAFNDIGPYLFRLVEIQDSVAGLIALIQDEWGYSRVSPNFFDLDNMVQITDPQELALVMLTVHG